MERIDVIIPAYNAHKTLDRCLSSIVCQSIADDLDITIVDDCSPNGNYQHFIDRYGDLLHIREIKLEKNGGPGVARQFGVDNTSNPFIVFIDADDTFCGSFALQLLRTGITVEDNIHMCVSTFAEELDKGFFLHNEDLVWMFGKIYRRSFWEKNNVRFHPTSRANEDNGINTMLRLLSTEKEPINFIKDITYCWHTNENSITRINDGEYSFNQGFVGFVENMTWAIQGANKILPNDDLILHWTAQTLCTLYIWYFKNKAERPDLAYRNFGLCQKFYKDNKYLIEEKITLGLLTEAYAYTIQHVKPDMLNVIPRQSLPEWLESIKG